MSPLKEMGNDDLSLELKKGDTKLVLHFSPQFFTFDVLNGQNSLKGASSALLIRENEKIIPFFPNKSDNWTTPNIKESSDEIGSFSEIRINCNFRSKNAESPLSIPGIWLIKIYAPNLKDRLSSPINYISIQIMLEKSKILPEFATSRLYGYAPLYMDKNGSLELNPDEEKPKNITFYSNGNQSWSLNYLLGYGDRWKSSPLSYARINMENQDYLLGGRYQSELHSVISDKSSKNSMVLSFITLKDQFSRILMDRLNSEGKIQWLCAYCQTDSFPLVKLNPGLCQSEILMISLVSRPEAYEVLRDLCRIGGMLAKVSPPKNVIAGWCSWYYYYTKISENEMLANLDFFDKRKDLPIDLIQLDDGYQTAISDWGIDPPHIFNDKFPHGLKWLVDKIHSKNKQAGLWVAPFFTTKKSKIFETHPEWALRNRKGKIINTTFNWGANQYGLDLSQKDVLDHMRAIGSVVGKDWGFNFLKIDFLFASMAFGAQYQNPEFSRAQIIRKGVQAIRDGLGWDNNLLGCGAPLGPCVGLTDIMRIGCDTAANWKRSEKISEGIVKIAIPTLKPALRATMQRSYMHNTFWVNDPDCVVVRKNKSKLTMDEILLQLTIFGLSRGQVLISDDEELVEEGRIELLKRILPPLAKIPPANIIDPYSAIPLDLFFKKEPTIFAKTVEISGNAHHLVAIINWEDRSVVKNLLVSDLMRHNLALDYNTSQKFVVFDYWNEKIIGLYQKNDLIKNLKVPKHGCIYLSITPLQDTASSPQFLSSTFHILQGVYEVTHLKSNYNILELELELPGIHQGSIYLFNSRKDLMTISDHSGGHFPIKQKLTEFGLLIKIDIALEKKIRMDLKFD